MSFWIHMKGRDGRDQTLLVDAPVLLLLVVTIALPCQVFLFCLSRPARLGWVGMGLMLAGLVALGVAKTSRFCHGEWLSWGPKRVSKLLRVVYDVAYTLVAVGFAVAIVCLIGNV